jgi:hypothetical protein
VSGIRLDGVGIGTLRVTGELVSATSRLGDRAGCELLTRIFADHADRRGSSSLLLGGE